MKKIRLKIQDFKIKYNNKITSAGPNSIVNFDCLFAISHALQLNTNMNIDNIFKGNPALVI